MSSKKSVDLGSIFRKAASVASVAAKHAIAAATASYDEDEMFPLKCCLMSISLPWDTIAHDLLFKVTRIISLFLKSVAIRFALIDSVLIVFDSGISTSEHGLEHLWSPETLHLK